jgi:hypothetical protein
MDDTYRLLLVLLPILFGLIATIQSIRASRFARALAIAQGAFQKPELTLSLFNIETTQRFYLGLPIPPDGVVELPMRYTIANSGQKSCRRAELFLRMSKDLHYGGHGRAEFRGFSIKNTKFELISEQENIHTFCIFVDSILPKQTIVLTDAASIRNSTSGQSVVTLPTKDGTLINLTYNFEYSYVISAALMLDDSEPLTRRFELIVFDTSKRSVQDYFLERARERRDARSKLKRSFFVRLKYRLTHLRESPKLTSIGVLFCDTSDLQKDQNLPIHRITQLNSYGGIEDEQGYFIPGLDIS